MPKISLEIEDLSIVEARNRLTRLSEQLENKGAIAITRRGKPVLAVMSYDLYDSLVETLEIMSDPKQMSLLRQSIQEVKEGKTVKWEDLKAELAL